MYKFASAFGLFASFFLFGGVWMGLISVIPQGMPRDAATCGIGLLFSGTFLYLLLSRLRNLYAGRGRFWVEAAMAAANLALLLAAFATIYKIYGTSAETDSASYIANSTTTPETKVTTFGDALYYSVVTFTTLGYGDLQPRGVLRFMACLETFVGYLVLGILASTVADLVQEWARATVEEGDSGVQTGLVGNQKAENQEDGFQRSSDDDNDSDASDGDGEGRDDSSRPSGGD
ncbi:potassium channel family protein [Alienimonas californiensis]|uniref:Ion channel n=1 Tax=Alienimonas californiensis TaxID=2527989 RepID=A0A517P3U8_9PLAN|nr:potassium channel family protein [Alienimonas californiensis]QDT14046.1 Ion channel [Alienimonas californiensis]